MHQSGNTFAQSICTHYSCFENMGRFVTLKKIRSKIWNWKKQGAKKQGHFYSKREEAAWLLLFLNNNDPVLLHPVFWNPYFEPFLSGSCFQNKNSGFALQIDCLLTKMSLINSICKRWQLSRVSKVFVCTYYSFYDF